MLAATTTMACCTSCTQQMKAKVSTLIVHTAKECSFLLNETLLQQVATTTAIFTESTTTIALNLTTTANDTTTTTIATDTTANEKTTTTSSITANGMKTVTTTLEPVSKASTTEVICSETTVSSDATMVTEEEANNIETESNAEIEEDVIIQSQEEEQGEEYENGNEVEVTVYEVSEGDYIRLCNAVAHEAGADFIATEDKAKVAEVIINRVLSPQYPDTILEVLTQPGQFTGAESYAYASEFTYKVSYDVECAVNGYLNGEYTNHGYFSFWGDGYQNHFS